jgi:hypothetical protein
MHAPTQRATTFHVPTQRITDEMTPNTQHGVRITSGRQFSLHTSHFKAAHTAALTHNQKSASGESKLLDSGEKLPLVTLSADLINDLQAASDTRSLSHATEPTPF